MDRLAGALRKSVGRRVRRNANEGAKMSLRLHDWCRQWLITADEATTRAKRMFGASSSPIEPAPLQLSGLEPRILFSATPIDPGMMPGGDDAAMVVDVDPESPSGRSDSESIATLAQQAPADQSLREIVIIDSSVPEIGQLLDDLSTSGRNAEVFVLDADRDGVDQLTKILDSRRDIDSIHIVSHAEDGAVKLGNVWLGDSNLNGYAGQIASWQSSLSSEADILFYGCDLAGSAEGRMLVDSLSALSGADVAASDDDTGHASYNADWDLEYTTGRIESGIAFSSQLQQDWQNKLATITVTTFADVVDGGDGLMSLREAVLQANAGGGGDTIILAAGTYSLSISGSNEDAAASGDLDLLVDVTITGADAATTMIDASGLAVSDRVLDVIGSSATISGVTVTGGSGVNDGGGIRVDAASVVSLDEVIVTSNDASNGGGIHNSGIVTMTDAEISGNGLLTAISGGGFFNEGQATLNRVTVSGNAASSGAGLYQAISATGNLSLTNVTVSGNTASSGGGGLYAREAVTIVNSTFVLNSASNGGGILKTGGPHTVDLANTLVAVNTGSSSNPDVQGVIAGSQNNLIGDGTGMTGLVHGVDGNLVGTGASPFDPLIDPALVNNGGFAPTHAITASSPAYNAGTSSGPVPSEDQRGETRDGSPDIGAFEVTGVNSPPTADAGGPYDIDEGEDLVLDASASFDPDADTLTYTWDIDGDGQFDDAVGVNPTISWASLGLMSIPINDDGSYTVAVRVDDGNLGFATDSVSLTVDNVAPTLLTTGTGTATAGVSYTLNLSANDPGNDTIASWTINWGDGTIETIAGNPSSVTHTYTNDGFTYNILASAADEDGTHLQNELVVASSANDRLLRYDTDADFLQAFATSDGSDYPVDVIVGPDGNLYVSGWNSNNVLRYNATTGAFIDTFVSAGSGGLSSAAGLAFGPDGNLYVASRLTSEVLRFDGATGAFIDAFVTAGAGGLSEPEGLTFGPNGNLYVSDYLNSAVYKYDGNTGAFISVFVTSGSGGLDLGEDLAFGPDGNLYVASDNGDSVLRYNGTTGAFIDAFVTTGSGGLSAATGIAFGPDGNLYVGSWSSDNVLRYDGTSGAFIDEFINAGSGGLGETDYFSFIPGHQVAMGANNPPAVSATPGALSYTEDTGRKILDGGITVSDPNGMLDSATIQFVMNHTSTEDVLHFTNQNGIAGSYNAATGILALTGTASVADYQTALRSIEYENTSLNPNESMRIVSITVNDGTSSSGTSRSININAIGPLAVDTTSDVADGNTTSISALTTNKGADGKISLREAILAANNTLGLDTIEFEIRDALVAGAHTIVVSAAGLPDIIDSVIIDGSTDNDFGTSPIIELDGSAVAGDGLVLAAGSDNSVIRSLVINRFGDNGIEVFGSNGTKIVSNYIGTDVTGTVDLGNGNDGVHVRDSANTTIGGTIGSEGNLLSGNQDDGIGINNSTGTIIQGNLIGTDFTGTLALGNTDEGITIRNGSTGTIVGGSSPQDRNIISGNLDSGVRVADATVSNDTILGNYIGTDINGNLDLGNAGNGVLVELGASDLTIGGTGTDDGNVISGNELDGVLILDSNQVTIEGNRIGTNAAGTADVGNTRDGIRIDNSSNIQIGGTTGGADNLISGNDNHGIHLLGGSSSNTIEGNFIGTNESGTGALGNSADGVHVAGGSFDNTIGGTAPNAGNLISGNGDDGITLYDVGTSGNGVYGNLIGTDVTGNAAIGNLDLGIAVRGGATDNEIGGTGLNEANTIAFNGTAGVAIYDDLAGTARNRISGNSIYGHAGIGIDLVDGNNDRRAATITSATTNGTSLTIEGSYADATLGSDMLTIEYFKNATNAQQGKTYLGSDTVLTDGSGNATINHLITANVTAGEWITATVTDSSGNTSEFSVTRQTTVTTNGITTTATPTDNTLEDTDLVFSVATGNAITVDDDTTGDPVLRTTLTVTNGVLNLATTAGLTSVIGDGSNNITIIGAESAINTSLDGLTYSPTVNYVGAANLQVTTDLQADLLGYYEFTQTSPLGSDSSSAGGNDGTPSGPGAAPDPHAVFDGDRNSDVLVLDGVDDNVQIAGRFGTSTDVTLAAWVNVAAVNNQEVISIGSSIALRLNDVNNGAGVTGFYHDGSAWNHTDSLQFIGGDGWHHVAFTFDDVTDTQVIYIDGVALGTTGYTGSINWAHQPNTTIGSHANGSSYWLSGMLDDARIYDRALSAGEIQALASDQFSDTEAVSITVDPDNDPPTVANTIPNQTATEDAAFSFQFAAGTFNDLDGDPLSYSATQSDASPLPSWLSFDATTRTFSGTPADGDVGSITIRVTATDPSAASTFDDFVLTIENVNDAPVLDDNGDLSLDNIQQNMPAATNDGNSVIEILASGGGTPISDVDGNLTGIAIISADDSDGIWEFSTDSGDTWNGIDPDGVGATVINTQNALLLTADAGHLNRIRFNPNTGFAGSAGDIEFHAWDGTELPSVGNGNYIDLASIGTGDEKPFSTTNEKATLWVNAPPTIAAVNDQAIMVNTSTGVISFNISDSEDSDGSLLVTATSSNTSLVPNTNIAVSGSGGSRQVDVTPAGNQIGSTIITLTVTDSDGAESQTSFDVFVAPHVVTVTTGGDVVDAADLSSIATLLANPGTDNVISLREAIIATNNTVNGADPDVIILPSGTYTLDGNDLDIVDGVKIQGNGANTTFIDGDYRSSVFDIGGTSRTSIHDVTIQNAVDSNGAITVGSSATLSLFDSTLRDNVGGHGGALHVDGTINVNRVTFTDNTADKGGAIYLHAANGATLTNVTLSGNQATDKGGAIFAENSSVTITNSTIAFNEATNEGAAFYGSGGAHVFTLRNTILAENHLGDGSHENVAVGTNVTSLGYNIDSDGTAGIAAAGDLSGTPIADLDVGLMALALNGGTTLTHALAADSIAIDAGTSTGAPSIDQRGTSRPLDGDGDTVAAVDIGAFESSNASASGAPSIAGMTKENETLTADTSAINDPDGIGSFSFQWLRNGTTISGATASTYVLGDADVGTQISVDVSYIDGGGTRERLTSPQVGPIANVNDSPVGSVNITGIATQGQVLTASNAFTDDDGVGVIHYQWKRDGIAITGATAQTYTLTDSDIGAAITVVALYTDNHGTSESVLSSPTAPVAALPLPPPPPPPPPIDPGDPPPVDDPPPDDDPAEDPDEEDEGEENTNTNSGPSVPPPPPKPDETPDPDVTEDAEAESESPVVVPASSAAAVQGDSDGGTHAKAAMDRHGERVARSSTEELIASGEHAEYAVMSRPGMLWNELDERLKNVDSHVHGDLIVVGTAGAAASSFTVGVVAWTLRTGFLASGLLAQMPAWRTVDPMLIMQGLSGGENAETLEELMERERESLDD